jgi:SAM-dependent methyltransferase
MAPNTLAQQGAVVAQARAVRGKLGRAQLAAETFVRRLLGLRGSQEQLVRESREFWQAAPSQSLSEDAHWRGNGIFAEDARWIAIGLEHWRVYEEFARAIELKRPLNRIVEWGCGGGANAIHFGKEAQEFFGVDVSSRSLDECGRQMRGAGLQNFLPALIDPARPEEVHSQIRGPCDLFLSTYVFELLPDPEYGIRVLRIAHELLAPGGVAVIQIKYKTNSWKTEARRWGYARNLAWNATYGIDEFWTIAEQCGFIPRLISLVPNQPLVNDKNYAYFLLVK